MFQTVSTMLITKMGFKTVIMAAFFHPVAMELCIAQTQKTPAGPVYRMTCRADEGSVHEFVLNMERV